MRKCVFGTYADNEGPDQFANPLWAFLSAFKNYCRIYRLSLGVTDCMWESPTICGSSTLWRSPPAHGNHRLYVAFTAYIWGSQTDVEITDYMWGTPTIFGDHRLYVEITYMWGSLAICRDHRLYVGINNICGGQRLSVGITENIWGSPTICENKILWFCWLI